MRLWVPDTTRSVPKNVMGSSTVAMQELTTTIEREGDGYVALCPELDIASQGDTEAEARDNLIEALELFFEVASAEEVQRRLS